MASGKFHGLMQTNTPRPRNARASYREHWGPHRFERLGDLVLVPAGEVLHAKSDRGSHASIVCLLPAELIAGQLAIELFRYGAAITETLATGGLARWRLRIIDERLLELRNAPTLAELAGLCNLSVRQLTRGFRASRGRSIGEYVAQSQIDHAKRFLAGDESIKSIAYSMGFASPSTFSNAFRRATGQTPRQFRQSDFRTGH